MVLLGKHGEFQAQDEERIRCEKYIAFCCKGCAPLCLSTQPQELVLKFQQTLRLQAQQPLKTNI